MSSPEVQEPDCRSWTLLVAGPGEIIGHKSPGGSRILTTNPRMDVREIEVVPLSVAEKLATALEQIEGSPRAGIGCPHQKVARNALAEFRAAHPREDTAE